MQYIRILLFATLILSFLPTVIMGAEFDFSAKAGILTDMKSGKVLWAQNERDKRAPASTTKIMTAMIALENSDLTEMVEVQESVTDVIGTKAWIRPGEQFKLEELLYAMLLHSANDAAVAIAEHVGGSLNNFVELMNKKAQALGALDTHFVNPHGLDEDGHYTTAYDLALIAREAMKNEKFRQIVCTKSISWNGIDLKGNLINDNILLWQYEGATGIKTGYTTNAGNCIVASAARDGQEFISVVLDGGEAVKEDAMMLLDYGFKNFKSVTLVEKGKPVSIIKVSANEVPLLAAESFQVLLDRSNLEYPKWEMEITKSSAPIEKGRVMGKLRLLFENREPVEIPLVAGISVEKKITWLDWYFRITLGLFLLIVLFIFVRKIIRRKRKHKLLYGGDKKVSLNYRNIKRF